MGFLEYCQLALLTWVAIVLGVALQGLAAKGFWAGLWCCLSAYVQLQIKAWWSSSTCC